MYARIAGKVAALRCSSYATALYQNQVYVQNLQFGLCCCAKVEPKQASVPAITHAVFCCPQVPDIFRVHTVQFDTLLRAALKWTPSIVSPALLQHLDGLLVIQANIIMFYFGGQGLLSACFARAALKQGPSILCPALLQHLGDCSLQACIAGMYQYVSLQWPRAAVSLFCQSSTEAEIEHFVSSTAAAPCWLLSAGLYCRQTSICDTTMAKSCCQPVQRAALNQRLSILCPALLQHLAGCSRRLVMHADTSTCHCRDELKGCYQPVWQSGNNQALSVHHC